jgi:hypothetical protein
LLPNPSFERRENCVNKDHPNENKQVIESKLVTPGSQPQYYALQSLKGR